MRRSSAAFREVLGFLHCQFGCRIEDGPKLHWLIQRSSAYQISTTSSSQRSQVSATITHNPLHVHPSRCCRLLEDDSGCGYSQPRSPLTENLAGSDSTKTPSTNERNEDLSSHYPPLEEETISKARKGGLWVGGEINWLRLRARQTDERPWLIKQTINLSSQIKE